jgi:hypothetical protein
MKKLSLVIGIAAACSLPMTATAGTELYGNLKYSINSIDEDRMGGIDGLSGRDNVSLLGLKGTYGDNVKAFFHLQAGAPSDKNTSGTALNQRFYFGGLKGNFGQVAYGRMTNAYKFPGFKLDPFYNLSGINAVGKYAAGGATYGLSPATNGFTDNALQYVTPSLAGFKITGGWYIDDSNDDNHGYTIGGAWTGSGFNAGLVYASNGETTTLPGVAADGTATRAYGSYTGGNFVAAVSYEKVDSIIAAATEAVDYLYLTGTYKAKSINTDFKASYGSVDKGLAEGSSFVLGAFYNVTDKTQAYLTYSKADIENIDSKPSVVSLGAIHKFGMGTK